jgi:hypothetical protein
MIEGTVMGDYLKNQYEKEKFEKETNIPATVTSPRNDHKDEALRFYNKNVFGTSLQQEFMSRMGQNKKPQGATVKDTLTRSGSLVGP